MAVSLRCQVQPGAGHTCGQRGLGSSRIGQLLIALTATDAPYVGELLGAMLA
jgi:hypothetical protein